MQQLKIFPIDSIVAINNELTCGTVFFGYVRKITISSEGAEYRIEVFADRDWVRAKQEDLEACEVRLLP